jgi:single-strand DNA-binding protein
VPAVRRAYDVKEHTVNETNVTIVGRVVNKPVLRETMGGVEVANFRMASNERRFDRETSTWVDGDSLYVNVTAWRRLAFGVHACLDKGDPVVVIGRLYTREFEVEGQRRSITELEAVSIGPDLSRCTVKLHRRRNGESTDRAGADQGIMDADLPMNADDGVPAVAAA